MNRTRRRRCGLAGVLLASAISLLTVPGVTLIYAQQPPTAQDPPAALPGVELARWLSDRQLLRLEIARREKAGKWDEAEALTREELARSREILGEFHAQSIAALGNLASLQEARGDWAAARKTLEEVVAVRERRPDRKDWQVGDARQSLADFDRRAAMPPLRRAQWKEADRLRLLASRLRHLKDYEAAMKNALETERILHDLVGEDHPDYAAGLGSVAAVYLDRGDYARAEPLARRIVEIRKRAQGESHPHYAGILQNLAILYNKMGDYARAEPLYRQSVESYTKAYAYSDRLCGTMVLPGLASLYLEKGDYSRAEPLLRQLHAVVMTTYQLGDYGAAVHVAETTAKLSRQVHGEGHPGYAESLSLLGRVYMARADYVRAEPTLRQEAEIMKRANGESHPDHARALTELAELYKAKGDYARAEPTLSLAAEIMKRASGESHPDYARALAGLAVLYKTKGDYAGAEPLFHRAIDIMKRARGESDPDYVGSLNELANLYRDMGDYARAEPLYRRAIEIAARLKSMPAGSPPCYVRGLQDLAELYRAMGDHARAEPLLRQALGNKVRTNDLNHAAGLDALARLYLDMGDDLRAESTLGQALEVRRTVQGESHPGYAESLGALARAYAARGDHGRAEPLLRQALAIQKTSLGESHPGYAAAMGDLAGLYMAQADYARAEPILRQVLEIRRRVQGESHPDYARNLDALAGLYAARGDYARAEPLCRRAMEIQKRALGESHPDYNRALSDLAELYLARADYARAEPLLREALDHASGRLRDTSSMLGERQRLRLFAGSRHFLDRFLSVAQEVGARSADTYARVLDWKGAVDAELAEGRLSRDQPELRLSLEHLARLRADVARAALAPEAYPDSRTPWREGYNRRSAQKEGLEADLAARSAAFRRAQRAPGPERVTASLSGEEALIDLFEYTHSGPPEGGKGPLRRERRLLAFVLRPGRPVALVPLGPALPVAEAVRRWRGAVLAGRPDAVQAGSAELGRRVWDPLRSLLEGARAVSVAADGALMAFPFAALPGARPGSYLIEDLAIGYVASGRQLIDMHTAPAGPTGRGLLAVGGVDFQADPGRAKPTDRPGLAAPAPAPLLVQRGGFMPLPGTLPEAEAARKLYRTAFADQPADLLAGADPSEGELKRRLDGGHLRVVHLATHGFFESPARLASLRAEFRRQQATGRPAPAGQEAEDAAASAMTPLVRSGVVLAGGGAVKPAFGSYVIGNASEDGILTAEEVQALDLRGTELVVLSACETGLGDLEAGQGVLGLQRAFHAAGARAVMASLWKVDDAATGVLMERFYANLWTKKLPKREALRQAQLDVLRDPSLVEARRAQPSPRGIAATAESLPDGGRADLSRPAVARRGDPALWAAFLLSGDGR